MKTLRLSLLIYPLMIPLAHFATWFAGRLVLGHWPRPSVDDPKFIGSWVEPAYNFTAYLMAPGLLVFGLGLLILLASACCDKIRRRGSLLVCALSLVLFTLSLLYLWWDPLRIVEWYVD